MLCDEIHILYEKGKKPKKQPLGQLIAYLHNQGLLDLTEDKYWNEWDNGFKITYSRNLKTIMKDLEKIKKGEWTLK